MNFILWVILGTGGAHPAVAIDHAEYENMEACQQAADRFRALRAEVTYPIHAICTPKKEDKQATQRRLEGQE